MKVGERLKIIRKDKNMTQKKFADFLGVSKTLVSQIEVSQIKASKNIIFKICTKCGIREKWLLTGEGKMYSKASPKEELKNLLNSSGFESITPTLEELMKLDEKKIKKCIEVLKVVIDQEKNT